MIETQKTLCYIGREALSILRLQNSINKTLLKRSRRRTRKSLQDIFNINQLNSTLRRITTTVFIYLSVQHISPSDINIDCRNWKIHQRYSQSNNKKLTG